MLPLEARLASLDRGACEGLRRALADLERALAQACGPGALPVLLNAAWLGERLGAGGAERAVRQLEVAGDKLGTAQRAWEELQALRAALDGLSVPAGDLALQARLFRRHQRVAALAARQEQIRAEWEALRASWARVLRKAVVASGAALAGAAAGAGGI